MMLASRNCGPKWRVGLGTARAVMTAGSASRTRASAIAISGCSKSRLASARRDSIVVADKKERSHPCLRRGIGTVPGSTMPGYRTAARSSLRPMVRDDESRIRPNRRPAMRLSKTPSKKGPLSGLRPYTKEIVAGAAASRAARAGSQALSLSSVPTIRSPNTDPKPIAANRTGIATSAVQVTE